MLDPYRMVVVNILASIVLFSGIFAYRYIFPKRRINLLLLLILTSLLPLISILRKGTYESGDLSLHAKIAMSFYESLSEGNIVPQWAASRCAGYGCPDFIFMYLSPYYIISFFHFLGFSFISSIKLLLATSFISSGIIMYLWLKEELGKIPAFVSSIFYLFAPYHLLNMHFRVDIAEIISFVFLPLNFFITKKIIEKREAKWFFLQMLALLFLITSHQAISLISFPFIISYGVLVWSRNKQKKLSGLFFYLLSIFGGLSLSVFYWVPIILEKKYIYWGEHAEIFFLNLTDLLYSQWKYGLLFQGPEGQLSFIVGYIQLFVITIVLFLLVRNKIKEKKMAVFFITSFFIIFFMMLPQSKLLWESIPLIKNFQFTYRLLVLTVFFNSVIAGIIVKRINKKWLIILLCSLAILPTILNWGNRRTIPEINDDYLKDEFLHKEADMGIFTMPKWVDQKILNISKPAPASIDIIDGHAEIIQNKKTSTEHEYLIRVKTPATFKENIFYYPGWNLKINNQNHPFNYGDPRYPGLIIFNLNPGTYKAEFNFAQTSVRSISRLVSLGALSLIILYLLVLQLKKLRN